MSSRPVRTETDQMRKCFEAYLAMGRSRDIKLAATKIGVAARTAQHYRECLKWEDRITKYMATYNEFPPSALALIWSLNPANPLGFDALSIPHELNTDDSFNTLTSRANAADVKDIVNVIPTSACIPVIKGEISSQELKNVMDEEIINVNMNGTGIMTKKEYRLLLGTMIREFTNRFRMGDIKINTIYEFEKIVKLDMLLMGEATSRNNLNVNSSGDPLVNNEINITVEQTIKDPKVQLLIADLWRNYNSSEVKDIPNTPNTSSIPNTLNRADLLSEGMNRLGEMVAPSVSSQPIPEYIPSSLPPTTPTAPAPIFTSTPITTSPIQEFPINSSESNVHNSNNNDSNNNDSNNNDSNNTSDNSNDYYSSSNGGIE